MRYSSRPVVRSYTSGFGSSINPAAGRSRQVGGSGRLFASVRVRAVLLTIAAALMAVSSSVFAQDTFPSALQLAGVDLVKQGQGTRKKTFISLYDAGLYLTENSEDAVAIVAADTPMAIRLEIVSGFISSKKMKSAMKDGFDKSTGGDPSAIQTEIDLFASGFSDEINKKDLFDLVYTPETGVQVIKNGEPKVTVEGVPFKQALFGIWLSPDPVQKSLKAAMLGGR